MIDSNFNNACHTLPGQQIPHGTNMYLTPRPLTSLLQPLHDTDPLEELVFIPHSSFSKLKDSYWTCFGRDRRISHHIFLLHEDTNPSQAAHHSTADFFAKQPGTTSYYAIKFMKLK